MKVLPLKPRLVKFILKHGLKSKYRKQIRLFEENLKHPSLNVEKLEPKELELCSFRIDRKYRALFMFHEESKTFEIIDMTTHYQQKSFHANIIL